MLIISVSRGKIKDLSGKRFGRLVVVSKTDDRIHRHVLWKCLCDCGKECLVSSNSLSTGRTQSCGCLLNEARSVSRITHHMSNEKIYAVWQGMRKRCFSRYHKDYESYGGRGITVCAEWQKSFQAFYDSVSSLQHFGEKGYSLDRINNDGNYEPGNVRWATQKDQMNNTRKSLAKRNENCMDAYIREVLPE